MTSSSDPVKNDEYWMAQAIQQARKGWYSTHPNPRVGCVIVRDGELLASGYHEFPGGPHAEINALSVLSGHAAGCSVYVTLEPCSHSGKTPPCTDALIKARPDRVVIGMQDPNPMVSGRGVKRLQKAGIAVTQGVLESQAQSLNPGFIKRMLSQRPYVRVKMAASLDGRTALANGVSQWITGTDARKDVQFLRAQSSAILSTAETVIADNATLNVRLNAEELNQNVEVRQPVRVILDRSLKLTGREVLFSTKSPIWIMTSSQQMPSHWSNSDLSHVDIISVNESADGHMDLSQVLAILAQREINEVHTECGSHLAGALLQQGLVDEVVQYLAPCLFGNQAQGLFELGELSIMSDRINLKIIDLRQVGDDIKIVSTPEK